MKCIVKVQADRTLIPAYEVDQEAFEKLRPGSMYKADFRKARNPDHHRKGMRLVRDIFENQETYENFEDLLIEIKLKAGWYVEHITMKGRMMYIPKSMDFERMDQGEFETLYDKLMDIGVKFFGMDRDKLMAYYERAG